MMEVSIIPEGSERYEIARASRKYRLTDPQRRLDRIIQWGILTAIVLTFLFGEFFVAWILGQSNVSVWLPLVVIVALGGASVFWVNKRTSIFERQRQKEKGPNPVRFAVKNDGIEWYQEGVSVYAPYDKLSSMFLTRHALGILIGDSVVWLPRGRGEEDELQVRQAVNLILPKMTSESKNKSLSALRSFLRPGDRGD